MPRATVIVVHGYQGEPNAAWRPWLKTELESQDIAVELLEMPTPDEPKLTEWLATLNTAIQVAQQPVILVGHSLGGTTVLRYLERKPPKPISTAIIVAGAVSHVIHRVRHPGVVGFLEDPFRYDAIKTHAGRLIAFYSRDDTAVDVFEGELVRDATGAEWHLLDGYGHFSEDEGVLEFPELRDRILDLFE